MITDKSCSQNAALKETTGKLYYVYHVIHITSGSVYVGKAIDPYMRWNNHQRNAMAGNNSLPHFYSALRAYGKDAFKMIVESVHESEERAFERERESITELRTQNIHTYNVSVGGRGGKEYSLTQKRTHSEVQKMWSNTPEARARNSEAQLRPEVRIKKSQRMKEVWLSNTDYADKVRSKLTSDHNRKIHSSHQHNAWANSEQRTKMILGMNKPEVKEAQRKRVSNEGNPRAKLTWRVVDSIRLHYTNGSTMNELMNIFSDISYVTLRRVVTNKSWIKNE